MAERLKPKSGSKPLLGWARMEDVARLVGVTKMTVSRALREPHRVSPETRLLIEKAIQKTGFVPNRIAGSLTSRSTRIIAVLIPTIQHDVFAATIQGMADALRSQNYHLMIGDTRHSIDEEAMLVEAFLAQRPDGLVITGVRHSPAVRERLVRAAIPIVEVWDLARNPVDMLVGFSNFSAARKITRYLVACGYRRIGFIVGQRRHNERAQRREQGYLAALKESGLPHFIECIEGEAVRMEDGQLALSRMLDAHPEVDAVFCTNDIFAIGALLECNRRERRVPHEFGIAGFHDLEAARFVSPELTTVRAPSYLIGKNAADLLLARFNGQDETRKIELPFEIVARGTTRSPPAS